mgnify:CR=1 FL=1
MVWFKNGYIQDEIDGHRALGEPHLVHADRNGNNKIYDNNSGINSNSNDNTDINNNKNNNKINNIGCSKCFFH